MKQLSSFAAFELYFRYPLSADLQYLKYAAS